jgi:hypothetical protein
MKDTVIIHPLDAYGNLIKVKGLKQPNGKLSIDNPYHKKRIKIIERRPDT